MNKNDDVGGVGGSSADDDDEMIMSRAPGEDKQTQSEEPVVKNQHAKAER
jgi:hypothetical protein